MFKSVRELRNKEETSRTGDKWLQDEDAKLVDELSKNKNYEEIALEHKRTITGIKSRVISQIIYPQIKDGHKSIEDIASEYNIDNEFVQNYVSKIDNKSYCKKTEDSKYMTNKQKYMSLQKEELNILKLSSLENKLFTIEQKLDFLIGITMK